MKHLICIILLVAMPFMIFAQEYRLTLINSRESIKCEILGAQNGYLYYKTDTHPMQVVSVRSVKRLSSGSLDYTVRLQSGESIPFTADALLLFPNIPDGMSAKVSSNSLQQEQVEQLTGIKGALQLMAGITLLSAIASVIVAANAKSK